MLNRPSAALAAALLLLCAPAMAQSTRDGTVSGRFRIPVLLEVQSAQGCWLSGFPPAGQTAVEPPPPTSDSVRVVVFSLTERQGVVSAAPSDVDALPAVTLTPPAPAAATLGVAAVANPLPRAPLVVTSPPAVYRQVVETVFGAAAVTLRRVLRVDLDGDGTEEAIIETTFRPTGAAAAQPLLEAIVLRKIVAGGVRNIVVTGMPTGDAPPRTVAIAGVADVDGDGSMEILVRAATPSADPPSETIEVYRTAGDRVVLGSSHLCTT
jgi:hypothetical protein